MTYNADVPDVPDHSLYDATVMVDLDDSTDGGDYTTDFFETGDVSRIRLAGFFPGSGYTVSVHESWDAYDGHFVADHTVTTVSGNVFQGEVDLTARYFRVRVTSDVANICHLTVRAIERLGN